MVWTGPVGQRLNLAGVAMIPPPVTVRPELTDDDVAWLNEQMALTGRPTVRYAREIPIPSLPTGPAPGYMPPRGVQVMATEMASGYDPPSMALGLPTEKIR